jgi:outer membrane lipoprotein carrier protein
MRTLLTAVALCLLVFSTSHEAQTPDALARALQKRYQGIADFSADFVQVYRGGVLKTQSREEGKVSVKKPGRMRWTYVKPERKEFVSDGTKVYSYIPLDQRVIVSPVPRRTRPRLRPCSWQETAISCVISRQRRQNPRCRAPWR